MFCFVLLRYNTGNTVTMALVVCGTEARMEQAITMLKSAVLFTRVKLDLHIFVDDHLQMEFRNKVSQTKTIWCKINVVEPKTGKKSLLEGGTPPHL